MNGEERSAPRLHVGLLLLMMYLSLLLFEPQQFFPSLTNIRITYVIGLIVLCWALVTSGSEIRRNMIGSNLFWYTISFCTLCTLGHFLNRTWGPENQAYDELWKAFALFVMVILIVRTPADLEKVCWAVIVFMTINASVSIWFYHQGFLSTRMSSYFGAVGQSNSNDFAVLILEILPFPIILLQEKRSKIQRGVLIVSLFSYVYCLSRTRSRAGFLGLLLILASLILSGYLRRKYLLLSVMILGLIFVKTPKSIYERMGSIADVEAYDEDSNIASRLENFEMAFSIMLKRPLLGIGIGNYQNYVGSKALTGRKIYDVHNAYLQVGAEVGLPGLILFCLLITGAYKGLRKYSAVGKETTRGQLGAERFAAAASIAVIGYAFMAMTLSVQYDRILFFLMGLAVVGRRFIPTEQNDGEVRISNPGIVSIHGDSEADGA